MQHKDALKTVKTARGQLDAVVTMLEDERYCIDVSNQILATIALLKKANTQILHSHLRGCVSDAIANQDDAEAKLQEIEDIMKKLSK